ncbi:MAG: CsbD-like [Verrucomicrobiaceae bacterium]|nr:CsbD-like [Verrucomicrobiaceae bacterium]
MNRDRIEGNWKQLKGNVKERWGQFRGDDYLIIAGRHEQRNGKIQRHYGIAKEINAKVLMQME